MEITTSEYNSLTYCSMKRWYEYEAGGTGIAPVLAQSYFVEGQFLHWCLNRWWVHGQMRIKNMEARANKYIDDLLDKGSGKDLDLDERMQIKLTAAMGAALGYKDVHKGDPDKFEVLHCEEEFSVQLPANITLRGKLDKVLRDKRTNNIVFMDHKFLSNFSPTDFTSLPLTPQGITYCLGVKALTGAYPFGFYWDVVGKTQRRLKKKQSLMKYREEVNQQYLNDREKMFLRTPLIQLAPDYIERAITHMVRVISNKLVAMPPTMEFPNNCRTMYGQACIFQEACKEQLRGNGEGWNTAACSGLYKTKEAKYEELRKEEIDAED